MSTPVSAGSQVAAIRSRCNTPDPYARILASARRASSPASASWPRAGHPRCRPSSSLSLSRRPGYFPSLPLPASFFFLLMLPLTSSSSSSPRRQYSSHKPPKFDPLHRQQPHELLLRCPHPAGRAPRRSGFPSDPDLSVNSASAPSPWNSIARPPFPSSSSSNRS